MPMERERSEDMGTTAESDVLSEVREVTDEEVAFFDEHGWVMLRGLFSTDLAARLLEAAETLTREPEGTAAEGSRSRRPLARAGLEPFPTVAWGGPMATAAHRLINRAKLT